MAAMHRARVLHGLCAEPAVVHRFQHARDVRHGELIEAHVAEPRLQVLGIPKGESVLLPDEIADVRDA